MTRTDRGRPLTVARTDEPLTDQAAQRWARRMLADAVGGVLRWHRCSLPALAPSVGRGIEHSWRLREPGQVDARMQGVYEDQISVDHGE